MRDDLDEVTCYDCRDMSAGKSKGSGMNASAGAQAFPTHRIRNERRRARRAWRAARGPQTLAVIFLSVL